tara:strand:- start:153 stop:665 length:513 start_codon:yes stop_codon:yes gene_type:complete
MKALANDMNATWTASKDGRIMVRITKKTSNVALKRWSIFYAAFAMSMGMIQWAAPSTANAASIVDTAATEQVEVLEVSDIQDALSNSQDMVRGCYERQLKRQPKLAGQMSVQFTISAMGNVVKVSIVDDSMKSRRLNRCVTRNVSKWTFPTPKDGKVTIYSPYVLSPMAG